MKHRGGLALAVAIALAACTANPTPAPTASPDDGVAILLASRPPGVSGCALAALKGTLVADPRTGLGVLATGGGETSVLWPDGWTARSGRSGLTLFDSNGTVLAHQGDEIVLGGGLDTSGSVWIACPTGMEVQPSRS